MKRLTFSTLCLILCGCQKNDPSPASATPNSAPTAPASAATAPATPAVTNPFSTLVGRWQRTDADYVIAIKSISPDGKADAAYFNPSPINVSWALAKSVDKSLTLELELRDQNYPGCLYKLSTTSTPGMISGTYYQAMTQMTYPVSFVREP